MENSLLQAITETERELRDLYRDNPEAFKTGWETIKDGFEDLQIEIPRRGQRLPLMDIYLKRDSRKDLGVISMFGALYQITICYTLSTGEIEDILLGEEWSTDEEAAAQVLRLNAEMTRRLIGLE